MILYVKKISCLDQKHSIFSYFFRNILQSISLKHYIDLKRAIFLWYILFFFTT